MTLRTFQPRSAANDHQAEVAVRRVPVIGQVGDGGVVTLYRDGREWLEAVQNRLAARSTECPG